jgi:hypothetical protein
MKSFEMGAQHWSETCGVCHVGGGQLEYNRDLENYGTAGEGDGDTYVIKYAELDTDSGDGIDQTQWDNVTVGWMDSTNKAEMDCLMCHMDNYNSGSAWLQTMDCGDTGGSIGPMGDPDCSGSGSWTRDLTIGTGVTAYDMYNRNYALKQYRNDLAASMGAGAIGEDSDLDGTLDRVNWGIAAAEIAVDRIQTTPLSEGCAVCHARDDNTIGLPGMVTMKTGFGNFGLFYDPSNQTAIASGKGGATKHLDTDNIIPEGTDENTDYWFDFGCKTGMGKRAHKINATNDTVGANGRYGMSMFMETTIDGNPATLPNAGDAIAGKMPDVDVHDTAGLQCATCHFSLGSMASTGGVGKVTIPAGESHGFDYPEETVYGMDHLFAQANSFPDTKGKNNLDNTVTCQSCHVDQTHPNTGTAPLAAHAGYLQGHLARISCVTCHVPEAYAAPARLKYRDWTAGFWRTEFKNILDWNYDLVTGSHIALPQMRKWADKGHGVQIYPFQPSLLPTWYEMVPNSGVIASNDAGMAIDDNLYDADTSLTYPSPIKNRDGQLVAEYMRDTYPAFDIRLNGGNTVPLFDGFQMADSWEIDTKVEIDAMMTAFETGVNGSQVDHIDHLKVIQADFDTTHGIVPVEWALGGTARGGCVSCHSSMKKVLSVNPLDGADYMAPNPDYSPFSVGFFEGSNQPVANAGMPNMGIGGTDIVKNWLGLFADFDAAEMCGMNDPTKVANDTYLAVINGTIDGATEAPGLAGNINGNTDAHNFYFDTLTGEPDMMAECSSMSWFSNNHMFGTGGWCMGETAESAGDGTCYYDQDGDGTPETAGGACSDGNDHVPYGTALGMDADCNQNARLMHVVSMMTTTFDQAMGFPAGSAQQMGMYDGIAGLQGFVVKELQTQGTLGCNGFAGMASGNVATYTGASVNNCMPDYTIWAGDPTADFYAGVINGTCTAGTCDGGFRNTKACSNNTDCSGTMQNGAEIGHNPLGLIYGRAQVKSHMKIDLQQSYGTFGDPLSSKVKWTAGGAQNPGNPAHVNSWDQAQYCFDYMTAPNPMFPNMIGCSALEAIYATNAAADGMCNGNAAGAPPSNGAMDCQLHIVTAQGANQFLGYTDSQLAVLMTMDGKVTTDPPADEAVVDATFSYIHSVADDRKISFSAEYAPCYEMVDSVRVDRDCTYAWDFESDGSVDSYLVSDTKVYPAVGTYSVELTMTMVGNAAATSTVSIDVVAADVRPAADPSGGFDATPNLIAGGSGTANLAVTGLAADVAKVYIFWGDRSRSVIQGTTALAAFELSGMDHTYSRAGTYDITVYTLNNGALRLVYQGDAAMTVVVSP